MRAPISARRARCIACSTRPHEIKERRDQVRRPHYAAPELLATRPNEVWSWDITKLLGPAKWTYFYLYVILDIFSRYVVGWMLAPHESAALAERLIAETCAKHGIAPGQLTLHADRGALDAEQAGGAAPGRSRRDARPTAARTSRTTIRFRKPTSRRSSTVRQFPERFGSIEDGRAFGQVFFRWYNHEHHHSGLGFLTPAVVHFGQAAAVRAPSAARARGRLCGASRALREGHAATRRSAHGRVDQPACEENDRSGCPSYAEHSITGVMQSRS